MTILYVLTALGVHWSSTALHKADCYSNGKGVYSVAVQIEMYYNFGKFAVEHCEAK